MVRWQWYGAEYLERTEKTLQGPVAEKPKKASRGGGLKKLGKKVVVAQTVAKQSDGAGKESPFKYNVETGLWYNAATFVFMDSRGKNFFYHAQEGQLVEVDYSGNRVEGGETRPYTGTAEAAEKAAAVKIQANFRGHIARQKPQVQRTQQRHVKAPHAYDSTASAAHKSAAAEARDANADGQRVPAAEAEGGEQAQKKHGEGHKVSDVKADGGKPAHKKHGEGQKVVAEAAGGEPAHKEDAAQRTEQGGDGPQSDLRDGERSVEEHGAGARSAKENATSAGVKKGLASLAKASPAKASPGGAFGLLDSMDEAVAAATRIQAMSRGRAVRKAAAERRLQQAEQKGYGAYVNADGLLKAQGAKEALRPQALVWTRGPGC